MAINLKRVLDGNEGQKELTSILANASNEIKADIESKKSEANIHILESYLNKIFYPVGSTSISTEYLLDRTAKMTEDELLEIFNNFNFEDNTSGYTKNKKYIKSTTIDTLINSVQSSLQTIGNKISNLNSLVSESTLNDLKLKTEQLINQAKGIMDSAEMVELFGKKEYFSGEAYDSLIPIVNQLMAFSNILGKPDFVSPQEAGLLFEKALAKTNFIENAEDKVTDELLDQVLFGAESIRRGGKNDTGLVSYFINVSDKDLKNTEDLKGFKLSQGQMSISYDPFSARQGKMDVQLFYNAENNKDYRISAKRWSNGYGDLGETSIDAGITRAAGQTVAEAYKYAVLKPSRDWAEPKNEVPAYIAYESAHQLAKLAISSDIAMGLNQGITASGAGYANLLVIDTGSAIKVKNLASIIESVCSKNKLSGYEDSSIESTALQTYRRMANVQTGRSNTYLGLMTSALNKMKAIINVKS